MPAIPGRHVQPPRLPEDLGELLTGLPDGRRIDERQNLLDAIDDETIEQALIAAQERLQGDVTVDVGRLPAEILERALELHVLRADGWRQQAAQTVTLALFLGKCRRLVQRRVQQHVLASETIVAACDRPARPASLDSHNRHAHSLSHVHSGMPARPESIGAACRGAPF